jgi:hypothetical protein
MGNDHILTADTKNGGQADPVTGTDLGGTGKRGLDVEIPNLPRTAFGEMSVAEETPTVQIDAIEGLRTDLVETFTGVSGTTSIKDDHGGREFEMTSGTNAAGYGLIRSKNVIRYRPGQGALIRFTARFGTPAALCAMRAGGVNIGTELSFGYNGTQFGILHRTAGRQEIQTLTISAGATGNETLTLDLDGTSYTISLTSGTAAHNAYEIVADDSFSATHDAFQNGDTVIFVSLTVGPKTGSYAFSSTGTAAGTFAETANGVAVTDSFINQEDWNITTLTGTSDPFILDPSKGNVYQIRYQYLGYGQICFCVEDPATGQFIGVHSIDYANANTVPHLDVPFFKVGWFVANLGGTTDLNIHGASGYGAVEGKIINNKNPSGHANSKTSIGTTSTNVIQFRVRRTFNGYVNLSEVFPQQVYFAVDGTKPAICEIHLNPTINGEPNWTYHDANNEIIEYDTAATTLTTTNTEIAEIAVGKTGTVSINLADLGVKLVPTDVICLAVKATSGTTDATASLTWIED